MQFYTGKECKFKIAYSGKQSYHTFNLNEFIGIRALPTGIAEAKFLATYTVVAKVFCVSASRFLSYLLISIPITFCRLEVFAFNKVIICLKITIKFLQNQIESFKFYN